MLIRYKLLFLNARLLNVYQTTVNIIKNLILNQNISYNTDLHLLKKIPSPQWSVSSPEKSYCSITEGRLWY